MSNTSKDIKEPIALGNGTFIINEKDYNLLMKHKAHIAKMCKIAKHRRKTDKAYLERRRAIERKSYLKRLALKKLNSSNDNDNDN